MCKLRWDLLSSLKSRSVCVWERVNERGKKKKKRKIILNNFLGFNSGRCHLFFTSKFLDVLENNQLALEVRLFHKFNIVF